MPKRSSICTQLESSRDSHLLPLCNDSVQKIEALGLNRSQYNQHFHSMKMSREEFRNNREKKPLENMNQATLLNLRLVFSLLVYVTGPSGDLPLQTNPLPLYVGIPS